MTQSTTVLKWYQSVLLQEQESFIYDYINPYFPFIADIEWEFTYTHFPPFSIPFPSLSSFLLLLLFLLLIILFLHPLSLIHSYCYILFRLHYFTTTNHLDYFDRIRTTQNHTTSNKGSFDNFFFCNTYAQVFTVKINKIPHHQWLHRHGFPSPTRGHVSDHRPFSSIKDL